MTNGDVTYIYGLFDPITDEVRYIGKSNNPIQRLLSHIKDSEVKTYPHVLAWIRGLMRKGEKPILKILECVSTDEWKVAEKEWIANSKESGCNLTNMVPGGLGGAVTGRKLSVDTRNKMSAKLKGRVSPMKGKCLSNAHKLHIGLANKGHKPRLGMRNSIEHNAKIGLANSKALKGRKLNEAEREARSRASKARWSRPGEHERFSKLISELPRDSKGHILPKEGK